ncbi:MAG: replicative DNA helicase, partial [Deltaproteobacteria bacterium]|nr:replicative DNA helicase [Deltaproteobacteria bacterium]
MTSSVLEDNLRKVPPQNLEAESSVLGGILLENEAINRVLEVLAAYDFYRESHRRIFLAMIELYNSKEAIDLITLSDYLKATGDLEVVGGSAYIASLASAIPTTANIQYYARIVKEKAQIRQLLQVLAQASGDLYEDTREEPLTIAARLCTTLSSLQDGVPKGFVHVGDVVGKT